MRTKAAKPANAAVSPPMVVETKQAHAAQTSDHSRWRLRNDRGRQRWKYLDDEEEARRHPQSVAEKYHLDIPTGLPQLSQRPKKPSESVRHALTFFSKLQLEPGNWACEYGGPMFLLPGVVVAWYVTGTIVPEVYKIEIRNYLFARQYRLREGRESTDDTDEREKSEKLADDTEADDTEADDYRDEEDVAGVGGWGLHIEGRSSVFGTTMNYLALRLLDTDADHPNMVAARACLHRLGGAVCAPLWAKFWLALLGLADWDFVNPVPPELWLLPDWVPVAPWRWWVHQRQVFLPMSYIYSKRYQHPLTDLTRQLRAELYTQPYESIDFAAHRSTISARDNLYPKTKLMDTLNWLLVAVWNPFLRSDSLALRAERHAYHLIEREDENSDFADLAPVNGPLNMIACFIEKGPDSYEVGRHRERIEDFLWLKHEGMLVNGTNGVQTWDTAHLVQAVVEAGLAQHAAWKPMLLRALAFLDDQQIRENCRDQASCYRHARKGAWAFSTREQGYTVSDCTAEALKAVLMLQALPGYPHPVSSDRVRDAVDILLTMQNRSGGCASYEPRRGSTMLEWLSSAEIFGQVMVEYDYAECTSAVTSALALFLQTEQADRSRRDADSSYHDVSSARPDASIYRHADIAAFIDRAIAYLHAAQRPDGAWYGSWGICFSYATMFVLDVLAACPAAAPETCATSPRVQRACHFFLARQMADGGWGESYRACETAEYVPHRRSQVVQTAWVCIALMRARCEHVDAIRRGLRLIMARQCDNGEWKQEAIEGVFNKSCMISYPNYKFIFTIKALGMYAQMYGDDDLL